MSYARASGIMAGPAGDAAALAVIERRTLTAFLAMIRFES